MDETKQEQAQPDAGKPLHYVSDTDSKAYCGAVCGYTTLAVTKVDCPACQAAILKAWGMSPPIAAAPASGEGE